MDPITAINQEFVRVVKEDWTREAAERQVERVVLTTDTGVAGRLRTLVGTDLIALGTWLKAPASTAFAKR